MPAPSLALAALAGLLQPAASLSSFLSRQKAPANDYHLPATDGQERLRPTLVHFMFELKDGLQHPGIWGAFFEKAPKESYMVWAHCTDHDACKNDYAMTLLDVRLVPTTWSVRGADLMSPYVHMLRIAMQETAPLAASGVMEKFIVISDSTLPIKPFNYIYWAMASSPVSDICISSVDQWAFGQVDGVPLAMVKHHQWVTLNRSDAGVLARDWRRVYKPRGWNVPLKEGPFAGKNRTAPRDSTFTGGTWYTATDEEAVWGMINGPLVLPRAGDLERAQQLFATRRCGTYVSFPHDIHPNEHSELFPEHAPAPGTAQKLEGHGSLLQLESKRFDHRIITHTMLSDPDAKLTIPPGLWHPYVMEKLGVQSLQVMRSSPYLFARKFSPCAKMLNYSDVILK